PAPGGTRARRAQDYQGRPDRAAPRHAASAGRGPPAARASAATRAACALGPRSDRPGVELEGALAPGRERGVEDVEGVEGLDARDQVILAEAVQRSHGEAAGVYVRAFVDERLDLVVDGEVAGERFLADGRI